MTSQIFGVIDRLPTLESQEAGTNGALRQDQQPTREPQTVLRSNCIATNQKVVIPMERARVNAGEEILATPVDAQRSIRFAV
jgi:hypothetical protein